MNDFFPTTLLLLHFIITYCYYTLLLLLQRFLDDLTKMPDVWFVNNWEAIQWMQKPTPINQLNQFEPWKCKTQVNKEKYCELTLGSDRKINTKCLGSRP